MCLSACLPACPSVSLFVPACVCLCLPVLLSDCLSFVVFAGQFPPAGSRSYQEIQNLLSVVAAALNVSSSELVAASWFTHEQLAKSSQKFSEKLKDVLHAGLTLAGASSVSSVDRCITPI